MAEKKNKYVSDNTQLMAMWNYDKNHSVLPSKLSIGSHTKVWWKCQYGHEWRAQINNVTKGQKCPFCAGKKVLQGFNDLGTTHKELLEEWHYEKNNGLLPEDFSKGSDKKVWWKCKRCGFEWEAMISSRTQGHGCRSCTKRIKGDLTKRNDIYSAYPELLCEWDYDLNDESPKQVLSSSEIKIHWVCQKCGHKWIQTPYNRAIRKSGCPVCANKIIIKGINDLLTLRPSLINEWNYEKNTNVRPEELAVGTNRIVWWRCEKGHEWQASVANRSKKRNTGCPICDAERKTSMPEKALVFYLKPVFPDIIESYKPTFLKRGELDVFIPSLSFAIEYDGEVFHKDIKKDVKKAFLCEQNQITLLRIREPNCPILPNHILTLKRKSIHEESIDDMVTDVIAVINTKYGQNIKINIDFMRDRSKILNSFYIKEKENSLLNLFPNIAEEWDYEKNEGLSPKMVTKSSNRKVWWKCSEGHSWEAKINNRTSLGTGCPICGRRKSGKNKSSMEQERFLNNHPLFREYDIEKNKTINIKLLRIGSKKVVWWLCPNCGHSWEAQVYTRVQGFAKCPNCYPK